MNQFKEIIEKYTEYIQWHIDGKVESTSESVTETLEDFLFECIKKLEIANEHRNIKQP